MMGVKFWTDEVRVRIVKIGEGIEANKCLEENGLVFKSKAVFVAFIPQQMGLTLQLLETLYFFQV